MTKIEVLNLSEYSQYIMIAMITVARNIIAESTNTQFHAQRLVQARQILENPTAKINTFKSLCVVSFDTSSYQSLTEQQKIDGGTTLVASVFNEACYIF